MKKDRPGTLVSVLARMGDVEKLESILFDETGTFGIRKMVVERSKRSRREHTVQTAWGPVRGKLGWRQGEEYLVTPEFESSAPARHKTLRSSPRDLPRRQKRFSNPLQSLQPRHSRIPIATTMIRIRTITDTITRTTTANHTITANRTTITMGRRSLPCCSLNP